MTFEERKQAIRQLLATASKTVLVEFAAREVDVLPLENVEQDLATASAVVAMEKASARRTAAWELWREAIKEQNYGIAARHEAELHRAEKAYKKAFQAAFNISDSAQEGGHDDSP